MTTQRDPRYDFSGGIQTTTTWQLRKPNEVEDAINGRFDSVIGAIVRRPGYTAKGAVLGSGKRGLGLHEAKWDSGSKIIAGVNKSDDTETLLRIYDNSGATWSTLTNPAAIDPDTKLQFIDSLGETYVAGKSTSTNDRMTLLNITSTPTVSYTRSLLNAPKARFIARYGASLYAINCEVDGTVYANRAYKSSPALGVVTFIQGDQDIFTGSALAVDSVRYLKAGMAIDVYTAGTETKYADITITSVDKAADTISYSASSTSTFATTDVSTGTDVITVGVNVATGTPVKVTSTTTVPAGLTSGTVYYAINVSSTTIKLATSRTNATAGTAIDITSQGSGTHTLTRGVRFTDNDEIWLDGRKNERYYLWNTDYPTVADADFIEFPPGADSDNEILGWAKTNNRLMLFTKNSTMKWDGQNPVTVYEDVGCISHDTICNIGDWLIWLDAEGKVRARNDATGQEELISRPIWNDLLENVPAANLANAAAGRIGNIYKLCLGTVNGSVLRLCYDFDSNTWAHEQHALSMTKHIRSDIDGSMKLLFLSDAGQMYTDESGTTDNGAAIPLIIKFGRTMNNTEQRKNYHGVYVFGTNVAGAAIQASMDGSNDWYHAGSLTGGLSKVALSGGQKQYSGYDINLMASISTEGEAPQIEAIVYYFNYEEDKFGQPT